MPREEARKWQRVIRQSVREACQTWRIQAQAGPVTSKALEAIVYRAAVPILLLLEDQTPEAIAALAPSVVRIMLAAAVEVVAEERKGPELRTADPVVDMLDYLRAKVRADLERQARKGDDVERLRAQHGLVALARVSRRLEALGKED